MSYKKKKSPFLGVLITVLIVAGALYVYFSSTFERNQPIVSLENNGYWNVKKPLNIAISDDSGIKMYKVTLKTADDEKELQYEQLLNSQKSLNLEVKPPRGTYSMKDKTIEVIVEAQDSSKWNLLQGNSIRKIFKLTIDKRKPQLNIVSNSYKISRGGSALVIFKVTDENMDEMYIEGNNNKKFKPQPFYKEGYYISLLAWPVVDSSFKATVVAKDLAGNVSKAYIPFYLKEKNYKISKIQLSDNFLKGKIAELAEEFEETQGITEPLEQFKIINEDVRAKNEKLIHNITSKVEDTQLDSFKINKMYPLKNAQVVAAFGDHRKYTYKGSYVSESYHLGLDLASNAMADIKPQNGGDVVYSDYNGLYGNMPIIHHGLGLYTLYGHCSSVQVNSGDSTNRRVTIAKTGKSGYAMGDHLHFGVLVQGIEVRPQEWMDAEWMKLNIYDVIKSAKEIIKKD